MILIGEILIFYCSCLPVLFLICIKVISLLVKMINLSFHLSLIFINFKENFSIRAFWTVQIIDSELLSWCVLKSLKLQTTNVESVLTILKNGLNWIFADWNYNSVLKFSNLHCSVLPISLMSCFLLISWDYNDYTPKLHHTSKNLLLVVVHLSCLR